MIDSCQRHQSRLHVRLLGKENACKRLQVTNMAGVVPGDQDERCGN